MQCALMLAGAVCLLLNAAALAQSRLPRTSPSELQVREINRSLQRQQRDLAFQQQTEFELNQLRHSLHRHQTFPSRTFGAICAPGQIRC
jgi:hypothetical protein